MQGCGDGWVEMTMPNLTTVCPADRPSPQILAKNLKQTKSQNPSMDTKLLTCLFATHHAQQLKTRPDPADCILCCAAAGTTTLNTRVKNPHREPLPIARAHCTRPLYRPLYRPLCRHCSLAGSLGVSGKGRFTGFPHGVPAPSTGTSSPLSHPSANPSPTLCQIFLPTLVQTPLSVDPRHGLRNAS